MTAVSHDARSPRGAAGLLGEFADAGVLESADVHVARRLARLGDESDEAVLLGAALAVRAVRHGSVCLDLAAAEGSIGVEDADEETVAKLSALQWPAADAWVAALSSSPLVAVGVDGDRARPLRLVGGSLYLDRYWRQEEVIANAVDDRRRRETPPVDRDRLTTALGRLFTSAEADRQRLATAVAAQRWVTVLAGGPGTGKTTTVAKLLATLRDQPGPPSRIALAAPTGKAAARLEEAVRQVIGDFSADDKARLGELPATTIHRLLGWKAGARTRFKHDHDNRLPYDVVVVDEASMVSLTLMARLVDALRTDARLILVGDPDQLASVEAGAVLGDLVQRPAPADVTPIEGLAELVPADLADLSPDEVPAVTASGVVTLTQVHRHGGNIKALAEAIKSGVADDVLDLLLAGDGVELTDYDDLADVRCDVVVSGLSLTDTAERGDVRAALAALEEHRLLCAHREGPHGVAHWSRQVEEWLREERADYGRGGLWYVGRPLLVTSNDRDLGLYNGDTGVVVNLAGLPRAVFPKGQGQLEVATNRLAEVATVHAMSVHKSQGSQFERVTLVLPEASSPLLTKELFYTAVTRAKQHVRVVGTQESVRAAVGRRIQRASGLGVRRE
jgi:exodeoxyribonuclease V alpha subunit